jgi:hypothetical protein
MKRTYVKPEMISEKLDAATLANESGCCCDCEGESGLAGAVFEGGFSTTYCT